MRTSSAARIDWFLLVNAMLGNFLAGLSARIFMISLPTLAKSLETDILGIAWALIAFQLASISLAIVFGRLGDIFGRRTIYGLGFVFITLTTLMCGFAQNVGQLIAFRFLQGIGTAMTQSTGRALAMDAVPEGFAGKAQGLMTVAFHSGFFVGPPLGGFIIEYLHWRAVFFLLVPIAIAGTALTYLRPVSESELKPKTKKWTLDYTGAVLFIVLTVTLTLLLDEKAAKTVGLNEKSLLAFIFTGALFGFFIQENRVETPIMNLSLFKLRMFSFSVVSLFTLSITRGLVGFLMPFYLQDVLAVSPTSMGFIFLAPPIFTVTLATFGGHLADKVGPRIPATFGVTVTIAALLVGVFLNPGSHWLWPTLMLALTGLGTAFFNSANQAAIIGSVPTNYRGFATGMVHTAFDFGHMLGVSLGGLLLAIAYQYYSGIAGAAPSAEDPSAFVRAMNTSYLVSMFIAAIALFASLSRGGGRIDPSAIRNH